MIIKVNEPILILEGKQAASWLAKKGYEIGLASPACYPQEGEGDILKLNLEVCLVRGETITENTEKRRAISPPDGIIFHRPDAAQSSRLNKLFSRKT